MILVNIIHGFLHGFTTGVREAVLNLEYVKYLNRTVVTQLSCRSYWLCDCTLAHYSLVIILSVLQWAVICLSNIQIYSTVNTLHTSQIQRLKKRIEPRGWYTTFCQVPPIPCSCNPLFVNHKGYFFRKLVFFIYLGTPKNFFDPYKPYLAIKTQHFFLGGVILQKLFTPSYSFEVLELTKSGSNKM